MALSDVKIDWNDKPFIAAIKVAAAEVAKDGAGYVAEEAKRNLERMAPDSTGTLASQIDVRVSQFEDGGYLVEAQDRGNYQRFYASFVEFGTRKMVGLHYLRKALRRGKFYIRRSLAKRIEAEVRD